MSFKEFLGLVTKNQVAWFFVGLVMVLLPEGGVKLTLGRNDIGLLRPDSHFWQFVLQAFGFLLMAFAVAAAFSNAYNKSRSPFWIAAVLSSAVLVGASWEYWRREMTAEPNFQWRYVVERGVFRLKVPWRCLAPYENKKLFLACRIYRDDLKLCEDTEIVRSQLFDCRERSLPEWIEVKCSEFAPSVRLGMAVECEAVICDENFNHSRVKTLSEAYAQGCKKFNYFFNYAGIYEGSAPRILGTMKVACPEEIAPLRTLLNDEAPKAVVIREPGH